MTGGLPPRTRSVDPSGQPSLRPVRPSDAADWAVLRIRCSGEGFAQARSFTRDTLHCYQQGVDYAPGPARSPGTTAWLMLM
jgi:hypothetical protein